MTPHVVTSGLAIGLLAVWSILIGCRQRQNRALLAPGDSKWSLLRLFLVSFLTIFLELALIRWIAVEIRIFAYVKNLTLLLCFLGFGLGCALAHRSVRWSSSIKALLGLLVIVRWPWYGEHALEGLSQALGAGMDTQTWSTGAAWNWTSFLVACAVTGTLMLLITSIFVPLGQVVSHQMDSAPSPLRAYSWNLAGNLAGIALFFLVSWASFSPTLWLATIFAGLALLQSTRQERILVASLMLPAVLLLHDPTTATHFSFWTPYQQIEVERQLFKTGEIGRTNLEVNHTGYQSIIDLSPSFLSRHPKLLNEPPEENPYNIPFRFTSPEPRVLIVGSGAGNDVAAALRNGARFVDAVEIDPGILKLGKREHPERPYDSARVAVHLTDARAFMKRSQQHYDLILFGLLDSHTELSDYSNMRIDNFVYTEESFREARSLLNPNGVLFVKFQVFRPWLGKRLMEMLSQAFGKAPAVFSAASNYSASADCFVVSESNSVESRLAADPRLAQFVERNRPNFVDSPGVSVTTDDWPYLYQEGHWIPRVYLAVAGLVVLLGIGLYLRIPEAQGRMPSLFFFGMGAGFLLLETQAISRLALYFGTIWQVNGIAIASLLATILSANVVTEKQSRPWGCHWIFAGLLASLVVAYWIPFSRIPGTSTTVGWVVAFVFAIPVFFAGLLFAAEFRGVESPSAALGANMLGAVVGGLLENASLAIGLRAVLLVAAALYVLAACGLFWSGRIVPSLAGTAPH